MGNYIHKLHRFCSSGNIPWSKKSEFLLLIFIAVFFFFYLAQFYISNRYTTFSTSFHRNLLPFHIAYQYCCFSVCARCRDYCWVVSGLVWSMWRRCYCLPGSKEVRLFSFQVTNVLL